MTVLGSLVTVFAADATDFSSTVRQVDQQVAAWKTKTNRAVGDVEKRFGGLNRAAKAGMGALGGLARGASAALGPLGLIGGLSFAGLAAGINRAVSATDSLVKTARRLDVGVNALQELRFAADRTGVSQTALEDALGRLQRRMGLFIADGSGPAAAAFERLGLASDIASGSLRGTDQAFTAAIAALEGIADQAERTAVASQLFGEDAGPKLANLVGLGAKGLADLRQRARDLLPEFDANAASAELVSDQLGELSTVIQQNLQKALVTAAPAIGELAGQMSELVPWVIDAARGWLEWAGAIEATPLGKIDALNQEIARNIELRERWALFPQLRNRALDADRERLELERGALEEGLAFGLDPALASRRAAPTVPATSPAAPVTGTSAEERALTSEFERRAQAFARPAVDAIEVASRAAFEAWAEGESARRAAAAGGGGGGGYGAPAPPRPVPTFAGVPQRRPTFAFSAGVEDLGAAAADAGGKLSEINLIAGDLGSQAPGRLKPVRTALDDIAWGAEFAVGRAFSDVFDGIVTGSLNAQGVLGNLLKSLADVVVQATVIRPLAGWLTGGSLFGFAAGGVMGPQGPVPLKRYSMGGVASSPQLAMFGEGSSPEAYVPLPDGRSIPVTMRGARGGPLIGSLSVDARGAGDHAAAIIAQAVQRSVRQVADELRRDPSWAKLVGRA